MQRLSTSVVADACRNATQTAERVRDAVLIAELAAHVQTLFEQRRCAFEVAPPALEIAVLLEDARLAARVVKLGSQAETLVVQPNGALAVTHFSGHIVSLASSFGLGRQRRLAGQH